MQCMCLLISGSSIMVESLSMLTWLNRRKGRVATYLYIYARPEQA